MIGLTLLNLVAIRGLLVDRFKLPTLFSLPTKDLGIHFSRSTTFYSTFLIANAKSKGTITDAKHHAFFSILVVQILYLY